MAISSDAVGEARRLLRAGRAADAERLLRQRLAMRVGRTDTGLVIADLLVRLHAMGVPGVPTTVAGIGAPA